MSRLIRHTAPAQRILIGDRRFDAIAEGNAEKRLGALFPLVTVMTQPDGSKGIPIDEIFKIETEHKARLKQSHQEGYDLGYQAGHETGLAEGLTEAREVTKQLTQAVQDVVAQREGILEEAKQNVLDIIIQIARKVTLDTIKLDHDMMAQMVARVIDQLVDKSYIKINVNPDHLPIVEQYLDKFLSDSSNIKDISFRADPRVRYGGCFIETPSGDIDARLSSQFEVVEQTLREGEDSS